MLRQQRKGIFLECEAGETNVTQTLIAWGILAALVLTALALTWAVRRNLHQTEKTRAALLKRLLDMRLSGLMQVMGIDPRGYLSQVTVMDVERQLRACGGCPHQHRCAGDLSRAADETRFTYCPVYTTLATTRDLLTAA